jgi:lipoprotein NlpI
LAYRNRGNSYRDKGDLDRAIADYDRLIDLEPNNASYRASRGYVRFYKAEFPDAATDFLRVLETQDDAYPMIYRYLARARAGESAAASELEANSGRLKTKAWPYPAIELFLGRRQPEATLAAADRPNDRCEAQYFIGEWHLLQKNRPQAEEALRAAANSCPTGFIEYNAAVAELKRLNP